MNERVDARGGWENEGLPPKLAKRIVSVLAVAAVAGAAVIFIGPPSQTPSGTPSPADPSETPSSSRAVASPPTSAQSGEPRRRAPSRVWRSVRAGEERAAVAYETRDGQRVLAVVGPEHRARLCHLGSDGLHLGDFVGDQIVFSDEGALWTIDPSCTEGPRRLVSIADLVPDGGPYARILCPSFSPDGDAIVFSVEGERSGTWLLDLEDGRTTQLATVTSCGWIDGEHVMALDWNVIDPFAIPTDASDAPKLLRDPHRWRALVSPDGTRAVLPTDGRRRIISAPEGEYFPEQVAGVHGCQVAGVEWNGTLNWASEQARQTAWHPSRPWFLLIDERDRLSVLDARGTEVDRVGLAPCLHHVPVAWFGRRAIVTATEDALEIFDFSTRTTHEVALPTGRRRGSVVGLVPQRELVLPVPPDPFLGESELNRVERSSAGFSVLLPPSWTISPCTAWCERKELHVEAEIIGPEGHRGGHSSGIPVRVIRSDGSPAQTRAAITAGWRTGEDCEGESCVRVNEEGTYELGGRRFAMIDVTFYEGFAVYLIGRLGEGSIVLELPARLHRHDLTVITAFDSIRFLD